MEKKRQQLRIVQLELITLLIGMCSAQIPPKHNNPCDPKPTPDHPFISWDETILSSEWWNIVVTADNFPQTFANLSANDTRCMSQAVQEPMRNPYYWEQTCPYTMNWLSKFDWYFYDTKWVETCYVLFPCWQNVRIATCTRNYCTYRCQGAFAISSLYSACLEKNLREYRDIWMFCPITYDRTNGNYVTIDCRRFPNLCLQQVTLWVPQCCECWSCWRH